MTATKGKRLFIHLNRIHIYPKNEIFLGKPYLFIGQHGEHDAVYGYLHDMITECRLIQEDIEVNDLYFRVKLLEQVKYKDFITHSSEE